MDVGCELATAMGMAEEIANYGSDSAEDLDGNVPP